MYNDGLKHGIVRQYNNKFDMQDGQNGVATI